MPADKARKQSPLIRWLNVVIRTLHLLAVVALAVQVLSVDNQASGTAMGTAALLVLLSGMTMFLIDLVRNPSHLREVAGVGVVLKLLLCLWMVLQPALIVPIFWALLLISSLISHAPKNFRHHIWWPTDAEG